MGCWNQTCGLSQIPIEAGDPVVAIVLKRDGEIDMACGATYCDDLWKPVGLPLYGEYDDYGMITNIDDSSAGAKVLIDFAFHQNIQTKDEGPWWPGQADRIVQAIDDISREAGAAMDWEYAIMMIARPVFDAVIKAGRGYRSWATVSGSSIENVVRQAAAAMRENSRHLLDLEHQYAATSDPDEQKQIRKLMNLVSLSGGAVPPEFSRYLYGNAAGNEIEEALTFDSDATVPALTGLLLLKRAMMFGRKMFIPQCGQGSQDDDLGVQVAIAHAVIEFERERERKRRAEGYYDEEDENLDDDEE